MIVTNNKQGEWIMNKKILIAGESWSSTTIHTKGFDSFITSEYSEGVRWLREALEKGGYDVTFMPNHYASEQFPRTMDAIMHYDAIILSDIGANTLLLAHETFTQSMKVPNRCDLIRDYVLNGGSLCMIGGYLTFTGIDAKGRWGQTSVKDVLPVTLLDIDDRQENPQGIVPTILEPTHQVLAGIPAQWPAVLGYNKTLCKDGCISLASIGGDPFIALGNFGKGRSAAFTTDCSPHWAPPEFCNWQYYNLFWKNLMDWLTQEKQLNK